jgi:hypothetical protein
MFQFIITLPPFHGFIFIIFAIYHMFAVLKTRLWRRRLSDPPHSARVERGRNECVTRRDALDQPVKQQFFKTYTLSTQGTSGPVAYTRGLASSWNSMKASNRIVNAHDKPPNCCGSLWQNELLPQNIIHRLSFCELINQLVQVANFLHQRIFDSFYTNTAHYALDKRTLRVNCR